MIPGAAAIVKPGGSGAEGPGALDVDDPAGVVDLVLDAERRFEQDAEALRARLALLVGALGQRAVQQVGGVQDGLLKGLVGLLPGLLQEARRGLTAVNAEHGRRYPQHGNKGQESSLRCERPRRPRRPGSWLARRRAMPAYAETAILPDTHEVKKPKEERGLLKAGGTGQAHAREDYRARRSQTSEVAGGGW